MSMLSSATPWDKTAEGYAATGIPFFEGFAEHALALAKVDQNSHILDVACGPGTLSLKAASKVAAVKAIDFSKEMLAIFHQRMSERGVKNIETVCGDAQQLPYVDNSFDAAFSMFGLMFFPNRDKGYAEIHRTLKPGGRVVISSWAPVAQSPLMQTTFGALRAMNPSIPEPQTVIDSLENPDFFQRELERAGFKEVVIHAASNSIQVPSIEEFWSNMVRGNAPLVMLRGSMSEAEWEAKNQIALEYLHQRLGSHTKSLTADAWLGTAKK